jgi:hypothetical protein
LKLLSIALLGGKFCVLPLAVMPFMLVSAQEFVVWPKDGWTVCEIIKLATIKKNSVALENLDNSYCPTSMLFFEAALLSSDFSNSTVVK